MYRHILTVLSGGVALVASTSAALAQSYGGWWSSWWSYWGYSGGGSSGGSGGSSGGGSSYSSVPEIDASTGLLALAALGAAMLLVWERRRRSGS